MSYQFVGGLLRGDDGVVRPLESIPGVPARDLSDEEYAAHLKAQPGAKKLFQRLYRPSDEASTMVTPDPESVALPAADALALLEEASNGN